MRTKDRKYREYSYFPYSTGADRKTGQKSLSWSELTQTGSMDLSYADQFSVTYYGEENYALVIIGEDENSW